MKPYEYLEQWYRLRNQHEEDRKANPFPPFPSVGGLALFLNVPASELRKSRDPEVVEAMGMIASLQEEMILDGTCPAPASVQVKLFTELMTVDGKTGEDNEVEIDFG